MHPTVARIQARLPGQGPVPPLLVSLIELQARWDCELVTGFQLDTRDLAPWFGEDREMASQFVQFAREQDGARYALWLYRGRTAADAPVVCLTPEGEALMVATDLRDFLSLLIVGVEQLERGPGVTWFVPGEPMIPYAQADEQVDVLRRFRGWLEGEHGITAATDPEAVSARARAAHPDLGVMLGRWRQGRGEG